MKGRGGGRSEGIAVLVRKPVQVHRGLSTSRATYWTRTTGMHLFSLFAGLTPSMVP